METVLRYARACTLWFARSRSTSRTRTCMFRFTPAHTGTCGWLSRQREFSTSGLYHSACFQHHCFSHIVEPTASRLRQSFCLHMHVYLHDWLFRHLDREILHFRPQVKHAPLSALASSPLGSHPLPHRSAHEGLLRSIGSYRVDTPMNTSVKSATGLLPVHSLLEGGGGCFPSWESRH